MLRLEQNEYLLEQVFVHHVALDVIRVMFHTE